MNKQFGTTNEMVIEMAKVIAKYISSRDFEVKFITNPVSKAFPFSHTAGVANDLYNAGYRKIPENAVVLTREEHDGKEIVVEMSGGHKLRLNVGKFGEMSKILEEYTRKETAEKFAERLKEKAWAFNTDENGNIWDYSIMKSSIDEICKEVGG